MQRGRGGQKASPDVRWSEGGGAQVILGHGRQSGLPLRRVLTIVVARAAIKLPRSRHTCERKDAGWLRARGRHMGATGSGRKAAHVVMLREMRTVLRVSGSRPTAVAPRPLRPESAETPTTTTRWPMSGSASSGIADSIGESELWSFGMGCGASATGGGPAAGGGGVLSPPPAIGDSGPASMGDRTSDRVDGGEEGASFSRDALRARARAGLIMPGRSAALMPPAEGDD